MVYALHFHASLSDTIIFSLCVDMDLRKPRHEAPNALDLTDLKARHSGESRNPVPSKRDERRWIPAFAGMTTSPFSPS
ncbi:MAG: hypothetical protein KGJ63_01295 [Pseudomonadota bacterium]|nr:hypothetical protein [Pseudomonadota bacterium]